MPRVTIGVPVYNSENLLEQCLANLASQTFKDLKVIVLDNASTDGTGAVAERFAAKDPRFVYRRQPQNRGALRNFIEALDAADTPYFMWRADDDLSDVNFVEELVKLLEKDDEAALAVGLTVLDKKRRKRSKPFPERLPLEPESLYRARLLTRCRAQWIYGVFRTDKLRDSLTNVSAKYAHVVGFDYLVLYPFVVSGQVVGSNKTSFFTGFIERSSNAAKNALIDPREMQAVRRDFLRYCVDELPRLASSPFAAWTLRPALLLYVERAYRLSKLVHGHIRTLLGERPFGATNKYD